MGETRPVEFGRLAAQAHFDHMPPEAQRWLLWRVASIGVWSFVAGAVAGGVLYSSLLGLPGSFLLGAP